MLIGAIIAAILSGSLSLVAENSLPGDVLYPVKINVNEGVRDLVAVSSDAQAKWDTTKIERRIIEAKTLQQEGKLDTAKKDILKSEVASHIQSLKNNLVSIEKSGNQTEVKNIKDNLGSLVSSERLALPTGERGAGQIVKNLTSTSTPVTTSTSTTVGNSTSTITAPGSVIVSNITATSTKGKGGEDEYEDEEEYDDFVGSLKDTVNNINRESTSTKSINSERKNNSESSKNQRESYGESEGEGEND